MEKYSFLEKYSNIILSICIGIFIYIILDEYDNFREPFDQGSFKCISNEPFIYIKSVKEIKKNLINDGYLETDSYESRRLLGIYDIILCDLNNVSKDNIFNIKILSNLNITVDTNNIVELLDKVISKCINETTEIILKISKVSKEETYNKYLYLNTFFFENVKQEFLLKIL